MQEEQTMQNNTLSDDAVSEYLRNNPEFFERNASLLSEVHLPSPYGKGTISLTERQQLAQRDKIQATESIMEELVEYGKKNDITNQQLHALSISLMANTALQNTVETISAHIKAPFALAHASLHCWGVDQANILGTPEDFNIWMAQQIAPYCGTNNDATNILLEAKVISADIKSFAMIPLFTPRGEETNKTSPSMGVLILGSTDGTHFNPDMGTLFLQRIGELISATIIRIATT